MKKFIDISEAPKTVAITFGRFNPPTIGHEKLCDAVRKANPSDYKIYASHSQNPKKDPLQYAKKIAYMKQSFPKLDKELDTKIEQSSATIEKSKNESVMQIQNQINQITKLTLSKVASFDVSDDDIKSAVTSSERSIN